MSYDAYRRALDDRALPAALVDLDAFDENAAALEARAAGVPIRVASKSVRCVALLKRVLERAGWSGVLAYSASETASLAQEGIDDLVVAYPTAQRAEIEAAVQAIARGARITLMVDDPAHVGLIAEIACATQQTVELWIDLDVSMSLPGLHFGVRRSPIRDPERALALAEVIRETKGVSLTGLMAYEAQIAGLPDQGTGILTDAAMGLLKRRSWREVVRRRAEVVAALREAGFELPRINGGGTGSVGLSRTDPTLTEIAAGSGLFAPASFDGFRELGVRPSAFFAVPVARRPADGMITCAFGGYIASGAAGLSRLPTPWLPEGLSLLPHEGAGEVQTPLRHPRDLTLSLGDPVFFRHAKAGELCERFNSLLLVRGASVVEAVPTYRGQGWALG